MAGRMGWIAIVVAAFAAAGCEPEPARAPAGSSARAEAPAGKVQKAPSARLKGAPTGGTCGGIVGTRCASAGDFCKLPQGQCRFGDPQGTCTARPQMCTQEYRPVCGCDGKTYGNACTADSAGVSVQAEGECPKAPGIA